MWVGYNGNVINNPCGHPQYHIWCVDSWAELKVFSVDKILFCINNIFVFHYFCFKLQYVIYLSKLCFTVLIDTEQFCLDLEPASQSKDARRSPKCAEKKKLLRGQRILAPKCLAQWPRSVSLNSVLMCPSHGKIEKISLYMDRIINGFI